MAETIIVSGPPQRITSTTVPFLAIDSMIFIVGVVAVMVVSCVLMLNTILTKQTATKRTTKHHGRYFVRLILENVWTHSSLMCSEPILRISSAITSRLISATWLLSVTVILIFMGCYLKTEFTVESYGYINTLSDLIESGIKPLWIDGGGTREFIEILAKDDIEVKKWLEGLDPDECQRSLPDLLQLDGYEDIMSGERALIISKLYLTWLLGEVLTGDPENMKTIAKGGGLFISKHNIRSEYMHVVYNTSWINSSPEMKESSHIRQIMQYHSLAY